MRIGEHRAFSHGIWPSKNINYVIEYSCVISTFVPALVVSALNRVKHLSELVKVGPNITSEFTFHCSMFTYSIYKYCIHTLTRHSCIHYTVES